MFTLQTIASAFAATPKLFVLVCCTICCLVHPHAFAGWNAVASYGNCDCLGDCSAAGVIAKSRAVTAMHDCKCNKHMHHPPSMLSQQSFSSDLIPPLWHCRPRLPCLGSPVCTLGFSHYPNTHTMLCIGACGMMASSSSSLSVVCYIAQHKVCHSTVCVSSVAVMHVAQWQCSRHTYLLNVWQFPF